MERRLKERLIGAAVLVLLAVIFIPMLLNDSTQYNSGITGSNIPARPNDEFNTRIVPLDEGRSRPETGPAEDTESGTKESPPPVHADQIISEENIQIEQTPPVVSSPTPTLDEGDRGPEKTTLPAKEMGVQAWIVQLGSFSSEKNAQELNSKLRGKGFTAFVEPLKQKSRMIYRVRVGPELLRSDAEKVRDKIKQTMQMDGLVVSYP